MPLVHMLHSDLTQLIIGACFEVYNDKGCGFLEAVYHECLRIELRLRNVPFESQVRLQLAYKGVDLNQFYVADLICAGKVLVEFKAVSELIDEHRAQILNYLNATGIEVGILVNFGHYPKLEFERFANTRKRRS